MEVRNATKNDISHIKLLLDSNFDEVISRFHSLDIVNKFKEYNSVDSLATQLNWKKIYVADDNGDIVGTGAFANLGTEESPKYSISNLYVLPKLHGKGIGKQIVNVLIDNARDVHTSSFHVPSTRNAIPFYEKFGFTIDEIQTDKDDEITWMTMLL